jgi:hypothetical protein
MRPDSREFSGSLILIAAISRISQPGIRDIPVSKANRFSEAMRNWSAGQISGLYGPLRA